MRKHLLILVFVVLPLIGLAQEMPFRVKSSNRYSASSMVGTVEIDSTKYYQLRFIQEFDYKKWGMGIDLDFLFDRDYHLKKSDWDHIGDFLGKIYYVRYGDPGDPIYGHFGGFPRRSVRNGLIMHNYSNMFFYPDQRNLGLLLGVNPNIKMKPEIEIFSSDIERLPIFSISGHFKPLPDSSLQYIRDLELGMALFTDRNQKGNLKYTLGDSLYHAIDRGDPKALNIFSFDYTLPILNTDKLVLGNYAEIAHIVDHGTGFILPGIYADLNYLKINLEYRKHGDSFIPGYFDHFYEEERCTLVPTSDSTYALITKEDLLSESRAAYGFYGKLEGLIGERLKAMVAWQNMYGDDVSNGKSLWFSLWVDTRYGMLENVSFAYSKTRVNELSLGKVAVPRAQMSASFTLSLSEKRRWFLIGKYSEKYKDKEGGINWWKDTKRSAAVGVKVTF
ncbi:MAG: hypothetical protein LHW46_05105 [Candidatus Cloacimonetes bacterium]|nr:hypothetical protein [Candidatus Cloacimonadota bacterium]